MSESGGHRGFKLHRLLRHRMIEAQQPGMQAKAMKRVVAIPVFRITADWMPHVRSMHANLVLATRLQFELNQGMLGSPVHDMEMGYGQFSPIIHR